MSGQRVLVIDDDPEFAFDLAAVLTPDYECRVASSGEEGLGAIAFDPPDAVILDLVIEGGRDGIEILEQIHNLDPGIPVIMVTNHPSPDTEAEALRRGAIYYLRKSAGRNEILSKLERCAEVGRTRRQRDRLLEEVRDIHGVLLSSSPAMREVSRLVDRAAAVNSIVLLTGESGTGKDLVAREIHRRSPRASGPFLPVTLTALSETIAESELFGHVKGAFTGALNDRKGHFESARGGTLFLNEIGNLSMALQQKLLGAIEERAVTPLGSSKQRRVDVRIVAATNKDLGAMAKAGTFMPDLLGRLSVLLIHVPPLRERPEDVTDLARYFLGRYAAEMGCAGAIITDAALSKLRRHGWRRNNVRELRNTIERALVLHGSEGALGPDAFDLLDEGSESECLDYHAEKERYERVFLQRFFDRAFRHVGGTLDDPRPESIERVAALTNLPPQTVRRKLREMKGAEAPPAGEEE